MMNIQTKDDEGLNDRDLKFCTHWKIIFIDFILEM